MALITLRDLGMVTPRPLFQNLSLGVGPGDRVAVVAPNGGGKSTLFRCIAGQTDPDRGSIVLSRGLRIATVEQDVPPALLGLTLHETVRRALPVADREHESWRVGAVLDEFDTPDDLRGRRVDELSGGWQRLALLARAWVTEPAALLLDEPTNHLDSGKIALLEAWINGPAARTPMLIASHDRSFLDACATRTLFLRPDISRLYAHSYSKARALLAADDAALAHQQTLAAKEISRLRHNAAELRSVGINSGSDLLQKKSMQLRDRAERLEATIRPAHTERSGDIRLASSGSHAKLLAKIRDLSVTTPDGTPLFRIATFDLRQGDRLVLQGGNGVGKSQLIRLLLRATTSDVPGITISPSVTVGYLAQGMAHLPETQTPHRLIAADPAIGDHRATTLLAGAGLPIDAQSRPIARLSPGQKARLALLALRQIQPNLYLLDEPTNHVDIPGQEQLEAELLAQHATCILVSHDRTFSNTLATRVLHIEHGQAHERPPSPLGWAS